MELVGVATERTTAATDAVLALAAAAAILVLAPDHAALVRARGMAGRPRGARVWPRCSARWPTGSSCRPATRELLWQPLYLALGVTMALFVVGAVRDWRGEAAGRRVLLPMLALAVVFYGITRLTGGSFLAFVVYEAAALLFSLGVYLRLATGPRAPAPHRWRLRWR